MRKFMAPGSEALKRLDGMLALMQAGDTWHSSVEEAEENLPKLSDLFSEDVLMIKCLLIISFTPQFMYGSTKVRNEEPPQEVWGAKKKKSKKKESGKKEKSKLEVLLDEIIQQ